MADATTEDAQDNIMRVPNYETFKSLKLLEYKSYYGNVVAMNWKQPHVVNRPKMEKAYLTVVKKNIKNEPFRKLELLSRVHSLEASDIWLKHDKTRRDDFSDPEVVDYYNRRQVGPMLSSPFAFRPHIKEYYASEAVLKRWCQKIGLDYDVIFEPLYQQAEKNPNSITYVKTAKIVMRLDTDEEYCLERNDMDQIWFEFLGVLCPIWSASDYDVYNMYDANRIFVTCHNPAADEFWTILAVHMRNKHAMTENPLRLFFTHSPDGGITKIKEEYPNIKIPGLPSSYGNDTVNSFNRPILKRKRSIIEQATDIINNFTRRSSSRTSKPSNNNDNDEAVLIDPDFDGEYNYNSIQSKKQRLAAKQQRIAKIIKDAEVENYETSLQLRREERAAELNEIFELGLEVIWRASHLLRDEGVLKQREAECNRRGEGLTEEEKADLWQRWELMSRRSGHAEGEGDE
ncbi:MAG: hypothetical protein M1812_004419 [Candelaria pacifica]|nr:MAG: hypothetical protein M1812_004419 [Candelaria pacifica]